MGEDTKIEWCTHTFNGWVGCQKVSPACDHCYAEGWAKRTGNAQLWTGERRRTSDANWRKPLAWNKAAAGASERPRVFCASLADVFDNQAQSDWREALWRLIDQCRSMDWLLLTKRPQNISKMLPTGVDLPAWPWPHVWLGTTVENQEEADRRIPHLLATPAAVRFLSCEPLLGTVDLTAIPRTQSDGFMRPLDGRFNRLDWIIAGGESGPKRRPMDLAWMRSLRDQCEAAGVPFFGKQDDKVRELPADLMVRQFPAARPTGEG